MAKYGADTTQTAKISLSTESAKPKWRWQQQALLRHQVNGIGRYHSPAPGSDRRPNRKRVVDQQPERQVPQKYQRIERVQKPVAIK